MTEIFRSLRSHNYRLWAIGALVSNVGTWMQRVAQDWLVLTQLTHHDASAVGTVMALQFGPQLLLLPWTVWLTFSLPAHHETANWRTTWLGSILRSPSRSA